MHDAGNKELERYLNDHLAGSSVAILLIGSLVDTVTDPQAVEFFTSLKKSVEADRQLLEEMIRKAGLETSSVLKTAGGMAGRIGILKFMWEGFEPGELGLLEAIEMLAIGVQGKRLLWLSLKEVSSSYDGWQQVDFTALLADATRQRDEIETWRIRTARQCLLPSDE